MMKVFHAIVAIAATINTVGVGLAWHNGDAPNWYVWFAAMLFSIGVVINSIGQMVGKGSEERSR